MLFICLFRSMRRLFIFVRGFTNMRIVEVLLEFGGKLRKGAIRMINVFRR